MKVKMLTGLSGPEYCLAAGDEHEFGNKEAQRLIDAGFAVAVEPTPKKPAASAAKDAKKD